MATASASLALAACGGGDSTVQTLQPKTDLSPPRGIARRFPGLPGALILKPQRR